MEYTITALSVQKKNPNRVNVYLNGEFAFGLSRIVAAWLYVGQNLSEEKIISLKVNDAEEVAYQRTLNYIGYRTRSMSEVEQYLRKLDCPDEIIENVCARLERSGLVSNETFAQTWV